MSRLTNDHPQDNVETALNMFYVKGQEALVRGGGENPEYADVSLYDWVRRIIKLHKLDIDISDNDTMSELLYERLFDGVDTQEGIVAILYTAAWAFAELRARLAAYEDTGLAPEEISLYVKCQAQSVSRRECELAKKVEVYEALGAIDDLTALAKARDEGRVVVLPCSRSGAELYFIDKFRGEIYKEAHTDGMGLFWTNDSDIGDYVPLSCIGKTVFLTRAEAEAALKGEQHGTQMQ